VQNSLTLSRPVGGFDPARTPKHMLTSTALLIRHGVPWTSNWLRA